MMRTEGAGSGAQAADCRNEAGEWMLRLTSKYFCSHSSQADGDGDELVVEFVNAERYNACCERVGSASCDAGPETNPPRESASS